MAGLRRLSSPDLRELRAVILAVIEEGDSDGQRWAFYPNDDPVSNWSQANAEMERSNFCDAIQQKIFATALAKENVDVTEPQQDRDSVSEEHY